MRYSLDKYIVSFKSNDNKINAIIGAFTIGGEGSYLDNINISQENSLWSTTGYPTGGWVHNKNLDRHGMINITINQLALGISKLKQLANAYYSGDYDGITISVTSKDNELVATCIDCYPVKIPDQAFANTASTQVWGFTCGKIIFES